MSNSTLCVIVMRVYAALLVVAIGASCGEKAPAPAQPAAETLAWIERAEAAERARRYDLAREHYERAKRVAPDAASRAYAARTFARALVFWGEYADAERELAETVRLAPGHVAAWHDLGIVRHQLGDLAGAETALRRSIAIEARDPRSRIALAALLWKQKRHADALAEYRALLDLELPRRIRDKVVWAIETLESEIGARSPAP